MKARAVLYDVTRLFSRVFNRTPNGIDRVDFAFADHFLNSSEGDRFGFMTTLIGPRVFSQPAAREILTLIRQHWREGSVPDQDEHLSSVALAIREGSPQRRFSRGRTGQFGDAIAWIARHGVPLGASPHRMQASEGVYLNVSQFPIQSDRCMLWLERRSDIDGVFFVHDLLPLQFPEYFRPPEYSRHAKRLTTLARRGRAAIVSTENVRTALAGHLAELGRPNMPIFVAPLAPDPIFAAVEPPAVRADEVPYFVMCGTIEPRKNHLLILLVWRDLVDRLGDKAPKLIIVGERGWENEHILDLLSRSPRLERHIVEVSGLPTPSLKRLLVGARALLMPSFGEGYGLPVVEALAAGVPVIASDIPVFREIGDGRLTMIDPTDGPRWRDAICAFADENSDDRAQSVAKIAGYESPTWPKTLAGVEAFLLDLKRNGRSSNSSGAL